MPPRLLRATCLVVVVAACGAPGASPDSTFGSPIPATAPAPSPVSHPTDAPTVTDPPSSAGSATAPPEPASGSWTRLQAPGGPAPREDHTWTVDESGRTAYLFGGRAGGTAFDDLWAFDLAAGTWREIDVAGPRPAARFGHEAAWTSLKDGLVVTLGQAGSTVLR